MKYVCGSLCGWEYDESAGYPEAGGIAPGTPWSEVPEDLSAPVQWGESFEA